MTVLLGIDPGLSGGWALLDGSSALAYPMPLAGRDIDLAALAADWRGLGPDVIAVLEQVHAMPKQGVSSSFTFGSGYGGVRGVLAGLGIRLELVTPQRWKGVILDGTARDKDAAVAYVRRAFPSVALVRPGCRVAHDGMADAVCIAEFGRRAYGTKVGQNRPMEATP